MLFLKCEANHSIQLGSCSISEQTNILCSIGFLMPLIFRTKLVNAAMFLFVWGWKKMYTSRTMQIIHLNFSYYAKYQHFPLLFAISSNKRCVIWFPARMVTVQSIYNTKHIFFTFWCCEWNSMEHKLIHTIKRLKIGNRHRRKKTTQTIHKL